MHDRDLTALFLSYRERREASELARIFDSLAPGLLLLASHLLKEPADAEDCLQRTFVVAIEKAADFDPERHGLRAWLAGILVNRCKELHRHPSRQRRQGGEGMLSAQAAAGAGPADAASHQELLDRIQAAIDDLPETYRHVLILKLVHGLSPTEIAHSLGTPPGTVRAQLHRGLEQLKGRLPQGIGLLLAGLLSAPAALAQARKRVLDAARGRAPAPVPIVASRRGLQVLLPICVLVLLGVWAWPTGPDADSVTPGTTPSPGTAANPRMLAGDATLPPRPQRQRVATPTAGGELDWQLHGQVHDAAGAPVPGASLLVSTHCPALDERQDLGETRSDAAGAYAFDLGSLRGLALPRLLDMEIHVRVLCDGFQPGLATTTLLKELPDTTLRCRCDVQLAPGLWVAGKILDAEGAVVPTARVASPSAPAPIAQQVRGDGSYHLAFARPGRHELIVFSETHRLHREWIEVPDGGIELPTIHLLHRLPQPHRLTGQVRFPDGTPVPELPLRFVVAASDIHGLRGVTDARGRFSIAAARPGKYRLRLQALLVDDLELSADTRETDNLIELPCAVLRLRARTEDGRPAPVLGGQLQLYTDAQGTRRHDSSTSRRTRALNLLPRGRAVGVELQAGEHLVATGFTVLERWDQSLELVYREPQLNARLDIQARLPREVPDFAIRGVSLIPLGSARPSRKVKVLSRNRLTWSLRCEPGRYLLDIQADEALHDPASPRVLIQTRQAQTVHWSPRLGGRLRLKVQAEAADTRFRITARQLGVERPRQWSIWSKGAAELPLGEAFVSQLLRPGSYRLEVRAAGHRTGILETEVVAGRTQAHELRLEPGSEQQQEGQSK